MQGRRVAVTGLGIVSPLGNNQQAVWAKLTAGQSGIGPITRFDPEGQSCRIAGEVKDFQIPGIMNAKQSRRMDRFVRYAVGAAAEAIADAGVVVKENCDSRRAGVMLGSGMGGLPLIEASHSVLLEGGPRRVSPFFVPGAIINMASGWVSMLYGMEGPNVALVTACTTGSHALGEGARKIAYGDADLMVAGGAESTITPLAVAGFSAARALSRRNDEPERASCPFDRGRDGFVLSEGAGVLVLEELEHARARGAGIYCELVGYGMSGDAHHITAPPEDGRGAHLAMTNALADADLAAGDIAHVNAHGTSTMLGDLAETRAIRRLFGKHADALAVSGTKSMTGHLLGAAGGVEAVFTVLAIKDRLVPPTINLVDPDPQCDLDYVAGNAGRAMEVNAAMSNSFGFGGTNASLVFKRV